MADEMSNEEESDEKNPERNEEKKDAAPPPEVEPAAKADLVESTEATLETAAAEPPPAQPVAEEEEPALVRAAYEHPLPIRITHWVTRKHSARYPEVAHARRMARRRLAVAFHIHVVVCR